MFFYFGIVFLLLFFSFLDFYKSSIANGIMFLILTIILIFISGFRYGLETDYWSYWSIFHEVSKQKIELGYLFISDIIKVFTNNFNYFLLCIAILSLGIKCKVFSKLDYPFIALLLFFLRFFVFFELNGMRQGLATSFIILALYLLYKKQTILSFFVMCIAMTIHISSGVFILAYFMKDIKWNIKKIFITVTCFIIFRIYFLTPLVSILGIFTGVGNSMVVKATGYLLSNTIPSMSGMAVSIIRILLPVLCIYFLGIDKKNFFYFNMLIIAVFFNIAFLGMDTISYRLAMVFYSVEGIAVSQSIKNKSFKTIILIGIVIVLNLLPFYSTLSSSATAVPYRNYLFIDPNILRT